MTNYSHLSYEDRKKELYPKYIENVKKEIKNYKTTRLI